jgi:uroporphyrinogen-III decarboxylase
VPGNAGGELDMIQETMTAMERMEAAIRLEPLDRIPCAPLMDVFFPSKYKGYTMVEAIRDWKKGFGAITDVFDEVGGWDGMILPGYSIPAIPEAHVRIGFGKNVMPGAGLDENQPTQFVEQESLKREHYDDIINLGWTGFRKKIKEQVNPNGDERAIKWATRQMERYRYEINYWKERGVRSLCGAFANSPLMTLSTSRSLLEITKDIYRIPDKLEAVMEAMMDDMIAETIEAARISGEPGIFLVMERGGGFYYPLDIYERFEYPHMKRMVEAFAAEGFITVMHLDQDYTLNLPYFLDLPAKMVVAELDSTTDIFKAKEILSGHMCIAGDVPAAMLSVGTPEEVEAYCKKLIDVVGKDSGFILSTGCTCPVECKMDKFKVMINTVKNYYPH